MQKVFIKTYGCSFNQADSENMAGILEATGEFKVVDNEKDADLIVINSCTVKNSAENKFWRDVKKIKKPKILAGCVPQAQKDKSKFSGYSVIGTNQINNIVPVVQETLSGNTVQLLKKDSNPRLNIPKIRKNSVVEIVPINEGCLGSCNFCATKFARGHLKSYDPNEIVKHIRNALNEGVNEFWLTSQDTACYGYDIDTNIVKLIKSILEMNRAFKIRLGMGNPDFLPDYLIELIELFKDNRLYKFIHIPVQAGSNDTLKAMKREYTVETFIDIVKKFKNKYPDITVATDIIVGYPDETDEDFEKTMKLVEELRFDIINISRFWPRPGTIAAKKKQLPSKLVKERSKRLMVLFKKISLENNKKWEGWKGEILINEHGKEGTMVGRNYAYKQVIVKGEYNLGSMLNVKITKANTFHLLGEISK